MFITTQLTQFLQATWKSPIFGDTFPKGEDSERLKWASEQLSAISSVASAEVTGTILAGMPDENPSRVRDIVEREILPKTLAFCPALTINEQLQDVPRLSTVAAAVSYMYWGDQTMDRGDAAMFAAIQQLNGQAVLANEDTALIQARYQALTAIEDSIKRLAKPEDVPYVLACFNKQVLGNEAVIHILSQQYVTSGNDPEFLEVHGRQIAETMTISAGFPSISSSLYAIYRQHDASLPPLAAVYADRHMVDLLQVCNVVVRLWDELGDWEMDSGKYPDSGLFVINPFNQYDLTMVDRFCELAAIQDKEQRAMIYQTFRDFQKTDEHRQSGTTRLLDIFSEHIRQYIADLPIETSGQFGHYIELCKRVLEIGYVNHIGDMALADPRVQVTQ